MGLFHGTWSNIEALFPFHYRDYTVYISPVTQCSCQALKGILIMESNLCNEYSLFNSKVALVLVGQVSGWLGAPAG